MDILDKLNKSRANLGLSFSIGGKVFIDKQNLEALLFEAQEEIRCLRKLHGNTMESNAMLQAQVSDLRDQLIKEDEIKAKEIREFLQGPLSDNEFQEVTDELKKLYANEL